MVVLLATSGIVSQTPVAFVFAEDGDGGGGSDGGGDNGGGEMTAEAEMMTRRRVMAEAEMTAEEMTKTVEARQRRR